MKCMFFFHQPAQFVSSVFGNNVNYVISKQRFAVLLIVDYKIYTAVLMQFVCAPYNYCALFLIIINHKQQ